MYEKIEKIVKIAKISKNISYFVLHATRTESFIISISFL